MKRWYGVAILFAFDFAAVVLISGDWVAAGVVLASMGGALAMLCWDEF